MFLYSDVLYRQRPGNLPALDMLFLHWSERKWKWGKVKEKNS